MMQYYEAVLQLRNSRKEIVDFVRAEARANSVKIPKIEEKGSGFDIQLSSKTFAKNIGRKLVSKFGGKLKSSAKLVGRKNDKNIYRVTVCYEASEFSEGDVVESEKKIVKVTSASGNFISGNDLLTGKKVKIDVRNKTPKKLEKHRTSVSKYYPSIEVIHPKTYQSVPVENPSETKKESVGVVISEGKVYVYS